MKFVLFSSLFSLIMFVPGFAYAQLDSSYELLLGTSALNSSISTTVPSKKADLKKKRKPNSEDPATNVQPVLPVSLAVPVKVKTEVPEASASEPSFSQQAQSIFAANPEKVIGFYDTQFSENDSRLNKVEISFAPSFTTSESSSNFSYRNYRSVYTGMNLGANVWLTPALGVGGNFQFSLGADTSGDAVTGTRTPARFELLDVGFKYRKFFGFSATSKSVEYDLLYSDYQVTVPSDDLYRARLKTSGVGLKMTLRIPSSAEVAWLVGGSFFPRLQHSEEKTGISISSGNSVENTRMGLQLGSEVSLSQQSQVFYEASVSSEKNLFDGLAGTTDPATGTKPKNVSVSNSVYMFSLGYRWGN
jgi:hypothetical protein